MQNNYGLKIMKNCLFIFIIIFAGTGITTVTTGAAIMSHTKAYNQFLDSTINSLCTALMTAGSVALVLTIFGCYGGIKESFVILIIEHVGIQNTRIQGLLFEVPMRMKQQLAASTVHDSHHYVSNSLINNEWFAVFLIAISAVEVTTSVYAGLRQYELVQDLDDSVLNYRKVNQHKRTWDFVHQEFKCCGIDGKSSWRHQTIPLSCCHDLEMGHSLSGYCDYQGKGKYLFVDGCLDKLRDRVKIDSRIIMGVCIGSAFMKVTGIFLSCLLAFQIKKR